MLNLKENQVKFIQNELGISKEKLECISKEEWRKIREDCFEISIDELLDEHGHAVEYVTERCMMAESIADVKYSELTKQ